jgi:hypothetical protein
MIQFHRDRFNAAFTTEKYQSVLDKLSAHFGFAPTFRISETPVFISDELKAQLVEGCEEVISFIKRSDFKEITQRAIDLNSNVPNEDQHTQFLAIDFGICEIDRKIIPKLIEVQGFPSVFNFQFNLFHAFLETYPPLAEFTPYLSGLDEDSFIEKLRKVIVGDHKKEEVVLLEIEPEKQNTKIDFYFCQKDLGIPIVCVTEVLKEGNKLFYLSKTGEKIQIKRIYNRVIFDELDQRKELALTFSFQDNLEVEWAGHPNWYTRISKFILPYLKGKYFIETTLLSDLKIIPTDLENYVLKPLFSFSGTGVIFNVKTEDIENVVEKDLYILQKKVNYASVIRSPDGNVKAEVRILALWPQEDESPTLAANLVRMSRGEMIGVKFNKDKDWVGGTIGLFEK